MSTDERTLGERVEAWIAAYSNASHKVQHSMQVHEASDLIGEQQAEIERLGNERDTLSDVLVRNGFVPCDIAACNCGSWHARYGLSERWAEVKGDLADAGHPLCNENGNLVSNALASLIAERDSLRRDLDAARVDAERYRWLRDNPWPQEVREVVTFHMNAMWDEAIDLARARGEGNADE